MNEKDSAEPDWHAFYTESQTKLYHETEVNAALAQQVEELKKERDELARFKESALKEPL